MKHSLLFLVVGLSLFVVACGGGDSFRITGEIKGIGTQNLNIVYYGDGAMRSTRTAVVEGKFIFDGFSRDWTTVYIFSNQRSLIGMVIVKNGEDVTAHFDLENPAELRFKGNAPSELLGTWLSKSADVLAKNDNDAINEAVKFFVEKNPNSIAAAVVLTNYFRAQGNEDEADSLLRIIDTKSRPSYLVEGWLNLTEMASDSSRIRIPDNITFLDMDDYTVEVTPNTDTLILYVPFNDQRNRNIDRILSEHLDKLKKDSVERTFYEISRAMIDTGEWKTSVRADSLPWKRLWHPVNGMRLPLKENAMFLVADTTGKIIYNGPDVYDMMKAARLY